MSPPPLLLLRLGVFLALLHLSLATTCINARFQTIEEYRNKKDEKSSDSYTDCYWKAVWSGNCTQGYGSEPTIELRGTFNITGKCGPLKYKNNLHSVKCTCKGDNCNEDLEAFDKMLGGIKQSSQLHCFRSKLGHLNSQLKQQSKTERTLWIILGVVGGILAIVLILICVCCIRGYMYVKKEEEKMEENMKKMEEDGNPVVVAYDPSTGGTTHYLTQGKKKKDKKHKSKGEKSITDKSQKSQKSKKSMENTPMSSKTTLNSQKSEKKSQKSHKSLKSGPATSKTSMKSTKSGKSMKSHPESPKKEPVVASLSLSKEPMGPSKE